MKTPTKESLIELNPCADAAYAYYAYDASYDAAYASYAYDAAHAAAYDDESARASCRKEQADIIRSIIPCPFESESGVKLERKF